MVNMKLYKTLDASGNSCNGGTGEWFLPTKKKDGTWKPGKWMPAIKGELVPCQNGYHLCRSQDLLSWLNVAIYEAEYKGEIIRDVDKVVVRQARLLRRCEKWNEKTARLFAADCAEHILYLFEEKYPEDNRPRKAILACRDYANGKIDEKKLCAAEAAAWDAVRDVAWAAVGAAAWASAWATTVAAAGAWAGAAARDAARATTEATAEAIERKWQINKLRKLLK